MQVWAGTSGYSYKAWKGSFYPEDLPASGMLSYYSQQLPAVEINNTFYRLPRASVLEGWAEQVPDGFRFALKASRRITHFKRLNGAEEETDYLVRTAAAALADRAGVLLYQLPPNFKRDLDRLEAFVSQLPNAGRSAFEFRHESWFEGEVYDVLRAANSALCIAQTDELPDPPSDATADWAYLRLRKTEYGEVELDEWASRLRDGPWKEAYAFFKHEDAGVGPALAAELLERVQG